MTSWWLKTEFGVSGPHPADGPGLKELIAADQIAFDADGPWMNAGEHPLSANRFDHDEWWIVRSEKVTGPHTTAKVAEGIERGHLAGKDSLSTSANGPWIPLEQQPGFRAQLAARERAMAPPRRRFHVVVVNRSLDWIGVLLIVAPILQLQLYSIVGRWSAGGDGLGALMSLPLVLLMGFGGLVLLYIQYKDAQAWGIPLGSLILFGFCCLGLGTRAIYFYLRQRAGARVGWRHALAGDIVYFAMLLALNADGPGRAWG